MHAGEKQNAVGVAALEEELTAPADDGQLAEGVLEQVVGGLARAFLDWPQQFGTHGEPKLPGAL